MNIAEIAENSGKILIPKGKNRDAVEAWLEGQGITPPIFNGESRKARAAGHIFYLVKDADVLRLINRERADIGFLGSDFFNELRGTPLGIESCFREIADAEIPKPLGRFALAGAAEKAANYAQILLSAVAVDALRVATKYPVNLANTAKNHHLRLEIIEAESVETMIEVGESDLLFDIIVTGQTLEDNGLSEVFVGDPIHLGMVYKDMAFWRGEP